MTTNGTNDTNQPVRTDIGDLARIVIWVPALMTVGFYFIFAPIAAIIIGIVYVINQYDLWPLVITLLVAGPVLYFSHKRSKNE